MQRPIIVAMLLLSGSSAIAGSMADTLFRAPRAASAPAGVGAGQLNAPPPPFSVPAPGMPPSYPGMAAPTPGTPAIVKKSHPATPGEGLRYVGYSGLNDTIENATLMKSGVRWEVSVGSIVDGLRVVSITTTSVKLVQELHPQTGKAKSSQKAKKPSVVTLKLED